MLRSFTYLVGALTLSASAVFFPTNAFSHDRRFVYSYETIGLPQGQWEVEQWMTWKSYGNKDRFDFRHELEYGSPIH